MSPERRAALLDWARDTRRPDHRGRLRRRAPVRQLAGRRAARTRTRSRRLRRDREQDPRARPAPRLDDRARRARRAARRAQVRRRSRIAGDRAAGVRRVPDARRVRPAPAQDAAGLPSPARPDAGGDARRSFPSSTRSASPPGCTCSAGCRAGIPEADVVRLAADAGLIVYGATQYHVRDGPGGLIIGYGKVDDQGVIDGVGILRQAIERALCSPRPRARTARLDHGDDPRAGCGSVLSRLRPDLLPVPYRIWFVVSVIVVAGAGRRHPDPGPHRRRRGRGRGRDRPVLRAVRCSGWRC